MPCYLASGVVLDYDLGLSSLDQTSRPPDVRVEVVGTGEIPATRPPGMVLNEILDERGAVNVATTRAAEAQLTLRVAGMAEFAFDLAGARIAVRREPSVSDDLLAVLVTGMCLATYLTVTRHDILHASAVEAGALGGAIAFVGASGMGKSTMATVLAGAGCGLVADDILRIDRRDDPLSCHRGAIETRLRPKATLLAATFSDVHRTGDDRFAVRLPVTQADVLPLRAVIVPQPDPAADRVELIRLRGAAALLTLMAFPRLLNWSDPSRPNATLDLHAELVRRVPVFTARLPWGPPFPDDLAEQVLTSLGRELEV